MGKNRKYRDNVAEGRLLPTLKELGQILLTFFLVVIGWIIFRAESIGQAWEYFCGMWQWGTLRASYRFFTQSDIWKTSIAILAMLLIEWFSRQKDYAFGMSSIPSPWVRLFLYYVLVFIILINFGNQQTFIYFQF